MAITPDGAIIFLPSFEGPLWYVVRAEDGEVVARITPNSGAHNTIAGLDGKEAYLAGLKSPFLTVADTRSHQVDPHGRSLQREHPAIHDQRLTDPLLRECQRAAGLRGRRPDLGTKAVPGRGARGSRQGPTKRHGCPSHGIGLTPDDKELWLTDAANSRMHIFDATVMPPKQVASIKLRDQPGWITFSIDGRYAYPSTGDVIDTRSRKIVSTLKDETGGDVQSEKMVEVDFQGTEPVRPGDQFGLGPIPWSRRAVGR